MELILNQRSGIFTFLEIQPKEKIMIKIEKNHRFLDIHTRGTRIDGCRKSKLVDSRNNIPPF